MEGVRKEATTPFGHTFLTTMQPLSDVCVKGVAGMLFVLLHGLSHAGTRWSVGCFAARARPAACTRQHRARLTRNAEPGSCEGAVPHRPANKTSNHANKSCVGPAIYSINQTFFFCDNSINQTWESCMYIACLSTAWEVGTNQALFILKPIMP